MALIRIGEDGSDVYVYQTTAGYRCCTTKAFSSARGMMGHLYGHRSQGDTVPERVFEDLREREQAEAPTPGPKVTIYVTIGNSDDKLSQKEWAWFINDIRNEIKCWGGEVFGEWFSKPDSAYQNACFGAAFDHDKVGGYRASIRQVREVHRQDSVAFAVVDYTQLI